MPERFEKNQEESLYIPNHWLDVVKKPDWYLTIPDEFQDMLKKAKQESDEKEEQIKQEVYRFFESRLTKDEIVLGQDGPNWDEERRPIDTIVIHHTSEPPGLSWQKLNAMHLIRLYAPYYASVTKAQGVIKNQPIFSHHFRGNRQVFYAYHWLFRENGEIERLLNDDEIGWQAGNWDVNCRSIAICMDNDFEESSPPDLMLDSVASMIQNNYSQVDPTRIFGHSEINPHTVCPGRPFIQEWKPKLLEKLQQDY